MRPRSKVGMDWLVNLAMGAVLLGVWMADLARAPEPHGPAEALHAAGVSGLEDAFARRPGDRELAQRLAEVYLAHDRPGLAVATLRSADPALLKDPRLAHLLARAYEASGRLEDALATAQLALARCGRARAAQAERPRCHAGLRVALDAHRAALAHMASWGVSDPRRDPRARLAYDLAMRRGRIASAEDTDVGAGRAGHGAPLAQ